MKLVKRDMKNSQERLLNYFKKKENKEFHFLFSLVLVLITIPLPKYSLSSQALILLISSWIFLNPISKKITILKKNTIKFFILSIPFWTYIFGLTYSNNLTLGFNDFGKNFMFLIIPLIFSTIDVNFIDKEKILNYFPIGVFVAALFGVCKASFFYFNNLGDFFYYDQFAEFLNKHTTYFSLFTVLSIFIIFKNIRNFQKPIINFIMLLFFAFILYLLSVRISILALVVGIFTSILFTSWNKIKFFIILALPLLIYLVYNSPNFQKRFEPSSTDDTKIEDTEFRKLHWEAVLETVSNNSLFFGNGSGSDRDFLYNKYRNKKLKAAYEDEYNAHNQFLEIQLNYGLFGLLFFLFFLLYLTKSFIRKKNTLNITIILVFITFMLTESILERHSGIILFAFITSFLFDKKTNNSFIIKNIENYQ